MNPKPLLEGLQVVERTADEIVLSLPVNERMLGPMGTVSKGAIFLLADSAMEIVTNTVRRSVAQTCDIAFFGEAKLGNQLVARGKARHVVDRKGMCDVEVRSDDGTLIAEFRGHTRNI